MILPPNRATAARDEASRTMSARHVSAASVKTLATAAASAVRRGLGVIAPIWRGRTRAEDCSGLARVLQEKPLCENEASLLAGCAGTPAPHEVVVDSRRALLYARLRRRFPLRIAAPR